MVAAAAAAAAVVMGAAAVAAAAVERVEKRRQSAPRKFETFFIFLQFQKQGQRSNLAMLLTSFVYLLICDSDIVSKFCVCTEIAYGKQPTLKHFLITRVEIRDSKILNLGL